MVKTIAHGLALRHSTSLAEMWGPTTAYTQAIEKPIHPCPCCGSAMIIIEMFEAGSTPRNKPTPLVARRIDTS